MPRSDVVLPRSWTGASSPSCKRLRSGRVKAGSHGAICMIRFFYAIAIFNRRRKYRQTVTLSALFTPLTY